MAYNKRGRGGVGANAPVNQGRVSRDNQTRVSQRQNVNKDFCGECEREVKGNQKALKCDSCELWIHLNCTNVDESVYNVIGEGDSKGLMWFCQNCESDVSVALKTYNEVKRRQDAIEAKLEKVSDLMLESAKKTDEISKRMDNVDKLIEVRVSDYFKDREEKERKKLNIIVHGVPESDKREPGDRKSEDTRVINKIFRELRVEAEVENVIRLGRVVENKKRLIKVVLRDSDKKREILANAKKLKNSEEFSRIFISPDMTKQEREQDKILRERLKNERESETRDGYRWVIKNREILCLDVQGNVCRN